MLLLLTQLACRETTALSAGVRFVKQVHCQGPNHTAMALVIFTVPTQAGRCVFVCCHLAFGMCGTVRLYRRCDVCCSRTFHVPGRYSAAFSLCSDGTTFGQVLSCHVDVMSSYLNSGHLDHPSVAKVTVVCTENDLC